MILNPDASFKGPDGLGVLGMDINGQAADVAQVFPADGFEGVVLPIKVILIHHERFHREFVQVEVRLSASPGRARAGARRKRGEWYRQ